MPQAAWMKRSLFAAFALLVIAAVVAGCGGGDSSSSSSGSEESTEAAGGGAAEEEEGGGGGEEASGEGSVKIALLLPENETPRYETNDKPAFENHPVEPEQLHVEHRAEDEKAEVRGDGEL